MGRAVEGFHAGVDLVGEDIGGAQRLADVANVCYRIFIARVASGIGAVQRMFGCERFEILGAIVCVWALIPFDLE